MNLNTVDGRLFYTSPPQKGGGDINAAV